MTPRAASPAGRRRSRPGVVRAAAALLGLFGLLLVLLQADEAEHDLAVAVIGLVLLGAAAALLWAGRLGYWVGLAVAALLALLLVVALMQRPDGGRVAGAAVGALPLVLLLVPAARRPPRPPGPARSLAGRWGEFAFMLVAGGLLSAGGLLMTLTGRGAERGAGAATALFFLACLLTAPLFAPVRRRGRLRLDTVRLGDRQERGVLVPDSAARMLLLLVATACLALAFLGFVVFAEAFADDPGESAWPPRLVGMVGVLFFGGGGLVLALRGWGRRRLLLTPSAVVIATGGARTVVPWEAIRQVRATAVTTHARGIPVREPMLGIDLADPEAVQVGPVGRLLLPLNRRLAADLALPLRTIDLDPPLLHRVLRYYHRHPEARAELATPAGLARVRHGRFPPAEPAAGGRRADRAEGRG